jgi:hypothetical protein
MIKQLFLAIGMLAFVQSHAADSLIVNINANRFQQGDTISFDCIYRYSDRKSAASTLNVWIENIGSGQRWQMRYPLVNGRAEANLIIGSKLPSGKYALNFLVQEQFFGLKGRIRDYNPKNKGMVYIMYTKDKQSFLDNLMVNADGSFKLPRLEFADSARFMFSQIGKKRNDLFLDIETPLDSAFTPKLINTVMVSIGDLSRLNAADTARPYTFNEDIFKKPFTLEGVTVKAKKKKKVEQFDEEFASGFFKGGDPRIFDGIEDTQISDAMDIYTFLQGRVAGLQIRNNNEGGYNITWRGSNVSLYLDEFKMDSDEPMYVNPSDVAMIKVFPPNSGGPTNGGSICIYTKRGVYADSASRRYYFLVKGFTPAESIWQ